MKSIQRGSMAGFVFGLVFVGGACGAGDVDIDVLDIDVLDIDVDQEADELVDSEAVAEKSITTHNGLKTLNGLSTVNGLSGLNGLSTVNGLSGLNGLSTVNGLTADNGLTSVNGVMHINGLATFHGEATVGGKDVNCSGVWLKRRCTGAPDGLLNRVTGLMKTEAGVEVAKHVVKCALPPPGVHGERNTIRVRNYDGVLISMLGEIGLAPEWGTGLCGTACQEKVTACLLAFLNENGRSRRIQMTAAWPDNPIGSDSTPDFGVVESAFFGNVFLDPPWAYVVSGFDHASTLVGVQDGDYPSTDTMVTNLMLRSCSADGSFRPNGTVGPHHNAATMEQFLERLPLCPIRHIGTMVTAADSWDEAAADPDQNSKCSHVTDDPRSTAVSCSGPGTSVRMWNFPITTRRTARPWLRSL